MSKRKCPVCGKTEFSHRSSYEVCSICNWIDDGYQEDYPDEDLCANNMSLNQAREAYAQGKKVE